MPSHPILKRQVENLDFLLYDRQKELDNAREFANHNLKGKQMVLGTILQATIQWDRYSSCYDSALVHLLIIDEVGIIIVGVEVHGIILQVVVVITKV